MGDSHAALFAHAGWRPGQVKATYGTGSSVMGRDRAGRAVPASGLCLTVAWQHGHDPAHAVEGNIRSSGATLTWLAAAVLDHAGRSSRAGGGRDRSDGVHLVPAFDGLAAPWWDDDAVGLLTGLTLGTGLPELARAALESIAFQVEDVVAAIGERSRAQIGRSARRRRRGRPTRR